jgi:threonylcarbamoyladenosine tRNA methylthiotransferase CDKAL1
MLQICYKYVRTLAYKDKTNNESSICIFTTQPTFTFLLLADYATYIMPNPQTQIYIKNFGCSANTADGQVIAGCLTQAGFKIAQTQQEADIVIFNSCAVKGPTENRVISEIKTVPKTKKIIISGCLPKISYQRLEREVRFDGVVGAAVGKQIVNVVLRVLAGEKVVDFEAYHKPDFNLPREKSSSIVSVVPINYGCLGSCAYCCVKFARGNLRSYSVEEIVGRVREDFCGGAKEFWLTSQDTACYGRDIQTNLPALLNALSALEGDFKIRVGMMTPNMVFDIQTQLIEAYQSPKIFKFLHLPIQSGDDSVLKNMNRFYTAVDFKKIVTAFRAKIPDLTLATDIIVGYPGETQSGFDNTLKIMGETKPDVTNVSKFFARPKTAAAKIKEGLVLPYEKKHRSTLAAEMAKQVSFRQNQRWVEWVGEVLFDEKGKLRDSWVGRNFAYKPIAVVSANDLFGQQLKVKVFEASETYLKGELV